MAARKKTPAADPVHVALRAAVEAIRQTRGAPIGLGFLLERYLANPSHDVELVLGGVLASRMQLAAFTGDTARAEVVGELLAGADRLVRAAEGIASGAPVPTETERRRLRVPTAKGPTDGDTIRREHFLRWARMSGLLVERVDVDDLPYAFSVATAELMPTDRHASTVDLVVEAGKAWNDTRPGPRPEFAKWNILAAVASDMLGHEVKGETLKKQWAPAAREENQRKRAALAKMKASKSP